MNDKEMEQLYSLMEQLVRRYTSGDSSSVTYELAGHIMESILYCVDYVKSNEDGTGLINVQENDIKECYYAGYDLLFNKLRKMAQDYNTFIKGFDPYGNLNCYRTIKKAVPVFFSRYSLSFDACNDIITYDYPTMLSIFDQPQHGCLRMEKYIKCIKAEQLFLNQFPKSYVNAILMNYRSQTINICVPVLRNVLANMVINKKITDRATDRHYEALFDVVGSHSDDELCEFFSKGLQSFLEYADIYSADLYEYLGADIKNFVKRLKVVNESKYILNIVHI